MKKNILIAIATFFLFGSCAFADQFVPEFDKMQMLKCEINETIYNSDDSVAAKTNYHRLFRLDDPHEKLYIQKEFIKNVKYYGTDKIVFSLESMTDDFIEHSEIEINRISGEYIANSTITYDNYLFGTRKSIAEGICKE